MNHIKEISISPSQKNEYDLFFSRLVKKGLKSFTTALGKSKEEIQDWISEKLNIPLVIDTSTGKMESYSEDMKSNTAYYDDDYEDAVEFLVNTNLFKQNRNKYLMISPKRIVEYLFGDSTGYEIPEWDV